MGQLECQAMPYLCEVAHVDVLCTFSTIDQPQTGTSGMAVRAGGMDRPPHVQNHTLVTLLQQARRSAVLGQPSSLWPHWVDPTPAKLRGICLAWVAILS